MAGNGQMESLSDYSFASLLNFLRYTKATVLFGGVMLYLNKINNENGKVLCDYFCLNLLNHNFVFGKKLLPHISETNRQ